MSIFHFPKIDLKKTIHFIHFGVRPTNLMRPYLYALGGGARMRDDETIMLTYFKVWRIYRCLLTALVLIVFVHTIYIFNSDDIVVSFFSIKNRTFIYASNSS